MLKRIRERLDGAANPIMIREMYQSVHSKVFMGAFWVLLLLALLAYYAAYLGSGSAPGLRMFTWFTFLMEVMALLLFPCATFFSLYGEVSSKTLELVQITGMSARRLVRGRLLAAGVKIVLLFSVIGPFAVASFLFGGIDLAEVLMTVYWLLLTSFALSALAICFGSLAAYPKMRSLAKWGFLGIMFLWLMMLLQGSMYFAALRGSFGPFPVGLGRGAGSPGLGSVLVGLAWAGVLTGLSIMFLSAAAANALTFPHNRSSAGTKLIALAIVAATFGWHLLVGRFAGGMGIALAAASYTAGSCGFLAACCLVWITADRHVPYRHQVKLQRRGALWRCLYAPFGDGAMPTVLYLFLSMALVVGGIVALKGPPVRVKGPGYWASSLGPVVIVLSQVLYLSALAGMVTCVCPARLRTVVTRRGLLLMILVINALVPLMIASARSRSVPGYWSAFLPFLYVARAGGRAKSGGVLLHMFPPFFVGLVWHLVTGLRREKSFRAALGGGKAA